MGDPTRESRRRKPTEILPGRIYQMSLFGGPGGRILDVSAVDPPNGRSIRWVSTHDVEGSTCDRPINWPLGQFMRKVYAEVKGQVQ